MDILGKVHEQKALEGEDNYSMKLDLTGFIPGVYFINLNSLDQIYTIKIVIVE
jgi:hypothetical protein